MTPGKLPHAQRLNVQKDDECREHGGGGGGSADERRGDGKRRRAAKVREHEIETEGDGEEGELQLLND